MAIGRVNPKFTLEAQGLNSLGKIHYNLPEPALVELAIKRGEAELGQGGTCWSRPESSLVARQKTSMLL